MGNEAAKLQGILEELCSLRLDPDLFRREFTRALRRSLIADPEEFSALVFAEVWEKRQSRPPAPVRPADISLAMDRVKSRIYREARKRQQIKSLPLTAEPASPTPDASSIVSEHEAAERLRIAVAAFVARLEPQDAVVFEQCILRGMSVSEFIHASRLPKSSVYRRLAQLKERFRAYLSRPS